MSTTNATVYITTPTAASMLGYRDPRSVIRLAKMGELQGHQTPGGHWRIDRDSVEALIKRSSPTPQAS